MGSADSTDNTKHVAEAIATARTVVGYSIDGAAEATGISASIIRDVESGEIPVSDRLAKTFEEAYGVELATMIRPDRQSVRKKLVYDHEQGVLHIGTLGVRFRLGVDDNDVLLRGYSSAVRRHRQLPPNVPLRLREVDIPVLAELLDLTDPELDDRAQFWFGQSTDDGQSFGAMFRLSLAPGAA